VQLLCKRRGSFLLLLFLLLLVDGPSGEKDWEKEKEKENNKSLLVAAVPR
jgi:hypothetical protein